MANKMTALREALERMREAGVPIGMRLVGPSEDMGVEIFDVNSGQVMASERDVAAAWGWLRENYVVPAPDMSDRHEAIIHVAMRFMMANLDDVNSSFASSRYDDADDGEIMVGEYRGPPFEEWELAELARRLGVEG